MGALAAWISHYANSQLLRVDLVATEDKPELNIKAGDQIVEISDPAPDLGDAKPGEFAVANRNAMHPLVKALLESGLFAWASTNHERMRLQGTAMAQFEQARQSMLKNTHSLPTHYLEDSAQPGVVARRQLLSAFERAGICTFSPAGKGVAAVAQYCDRHDIPFVVQMVRRDREVVGVRVCMMDKADEKLGEDEDAIEVYRSHYPMVDVSQQHQTECEDTPSP